MATVLLLCFFAGCAVGFDVGEEVGGEGIHTSTAKKIMRSIISRPIFARFVFLQNIPYQPTNPPMQPQHNQPNK